MRVAIIVLAMFVVTTPSQASPSCMTQAEAREQFRLAHLYWHGDHCWGPWAGRQQPVHQTEQKPEQQVRIEDQQQQPRNEDQQQEDQAQQPRNEDQQQSLNEDQQQPRNEDQQQPRNEDQPVRNEDREAMSEVKDDAATRSRGAQPSVPYRDVNTVDAQDTPDVRNTPGVRNSADDGRSPPGVRDPVDARATPDVRDTRDGARSDWQARWVEVAQVVPPSRTPKEVAAAPVERQVEPMVSPVSVILVFLCLTLTVVIVEILLRSTIYERR